MPLPAPGLSVSRTCDLAWVYVFLLHVNPPDSLYSHKLPVTLHRVQRLLCSLLEKLFKRCSEEPLGYIYLKIPLLSVLDTDDKGITIVIEKKANLKYHRNDAFLVFCIFLRSALLNLVTSYPRYIFQAP